MSCISNNFSSFFLNSGTSEFSKYLNNGEAKFSSIEDLQLLGSNGSQQPLGQQPTQQDYPDEPPNTSSIAPAATAPATAVNTPPDYVAACPANEASIVHPPPSAQHNPHSLTQPVHHHSHPHPHPHHPHQQAHHQQAMVASTQPPPPAPQQHYLPSNRWPMAIGTPNGNMPPSSAQQFDGSFEFVKYLRHSTDYPSSAVSVHHAPAAGVEVVATASTEAPLSLSRARTPSSNAARTSPGSSPTMSSCSSSSTSASNAPPTAAASAGNASTAGSGLIDLDSSTTQKSRSTSRKVAALLSSVSRGTASTSAHSLEDIFERDENKDDCMELTQASSGFTGSSLANGSNSNDGLAFPAASSLYTSGSNSNASFTECSEFGALNVNSSASSAAKPLACFMIKENFEVHPSHKVEEGIFQHMNKLPPKKKENLKQLGVRFTGQMTLNDKTIIVDNFIRFCEEYEIKDHRPFLSLNQCGLNKPEQIKFARYLGYGLPTFTLFCIYSNFKNLFCEKRTETYTKDGYNLAYILDKTKSFLANTAAAPSSIVTPIKTAKSGGCGNNKANMLATTVSIETATGRATPPTQTINSNSNTSASMDFDEMARTVPGGKSGESAEQPQQQPQQSRRPTPTGTPTSHTPSTLTLTSASMSTSSPSTPTPPSARIATPNHLQMRPLATQSPQPALHTTSHQQQQQQQQHHHHHHHHVQQQQHHYHQHPYQYHPHHSQQPQPMNSIHSGHPAHYQLHPHYGPHSLHLQHPPPPHHSHSHSHQQHQPLQHHQQSAQQHVVSMQGHLQMYPHTQPLPPHTHTLPLSHSHPHPHAHGPPHGHQLGHHPAIPMPGSTPTSAQPVGHQVPMSPLAAAAQALHSQPPSNHLTAHMRHGYPHAGSRAAPLVGGSAEKSLATVAAPTMHSGPMTAGKITASSARPDGLPNSVIQSAEPASSVGDAPTKCDKSAS